MKKNLNQEDIVKLLQWKAKDQPSDQYLHDMKASIMDQISANPGHASESHQKFPTQGILEKFWSWMDSIPYFRPAASLASIAVIALALKFTFESPTQPVPNNFANDGQLGSPTNAGEFVAYPPRNIPLLMEASSDGNVIPQAPVRPYNDTNKITNPHFPFSQSTNLYPTSPWPYVENPASQSDK